MNSHSSSRAPEAPPPTVERLTYSVEESALALGVSKTTIYRLVARRILRPVPGLRHKRIPCQQVRRLAGGEALHGLN
jgi:excisionase family DNA binding protein